MISGLLKLMCRLSVTGYHADFEVLSRAYSIIDDNTASILRDMRIYLLAKPSDCIMIYNI
jgi:hypothetical protein